MIVNIKVTQTLIDTGDPCNPFGCPIVVAITNALPGSVVQVTNKEIAIMINGINQFIVPPWTVTQFVNAYDNDRPVQPFEFELEVNE